MVATHPVNTVIIRDSVFRNIRSADATPSALITSMGAEVIVENTCFSDSSFSMGPIMLTNVYGEASFRGTNNYVSDNTGTCEVLALVVGNDDGNVTCQSDAIAEATACPSRQADVDVDW